MDAGTMKDYIEDLIIKVNDACKAMEEAEIMVAGLRAEVEHWKKIARDLYQETKRCGTTHDTMACWNYEQWLEDND
jgi:hypothetical protein